MVYHYTGDKKYLDVAKRVAKYFMDHTEDYVPIDFAQPAQPRYEDNSAAAITACGILEIMKYVDEEEKSVYADFVDKLMDIMYRDCDFSHDDQGILQKCSDMYHALPDGIHHTLIYGDFYLLEALVRLNGGDALYY
jgi:unsaturated chondroitin disaccharide hydrolase